jgi:anti-sigma factor RsiW
MKPHFDELLPFYVNGTLSETDRAWVQEYLREHPKAMAELQWYQSLQTRLREDVPAVSSEIGMERALKRIRTEGPVPARRAGPPVTPGPLERLRGWLAALVPQPMLRPAFAGALAVVALQAVVITNLVMERDSSSEIRAVPPRGVVDNGPYLKVNFKADAREADIRLLLVEVGGSLAAGPGQLGDYYLRVSQRPVGVVTKMLSASAIVDAVAVVDALPGKQ